jgi:hypothetical protein
MSFQMISVATINRMANKLLRAPCAYPRSETAWNYGAENQTRRATLKVKTTKRAVPVPRARGIQVKNVIATLIGVCFITGVAIGAEYKISDDYAMIVDPAAKQQLGEKTFSEVMMFFHEAEKAIETKDLKALMSLYSENYTDGEHNKKSAEEIWKRIFATFEIMATRHNMKLVNMAKDKNMVIFRCSGLLLGVPNPNIKIKQKGLITIDNWVLQDHVLVKEAGKWELIGTYGTEQKRLWFDKPMHPLF